MFPYISFELLPSVFIRQLSKVDRRWPFNFGWYAMYQNENCSFELLNVATVGVANFTLAYRGRNGKTSDQIQYKLKISLRTP